MGALAVSGCFTTAADFRAEAETFILEDESVADGLGVALVSATCDEPADQEVGTVFECTAIDANGDEWGFEVAIAESDSLDVSVSERP